MGSEWNLNRQSFVDFFTFRDKVIHSFRENLAQCGHEIYNGVVCATSKGSDQPAHTRSLIRAFACRLNIP